MTIRKLMPWEIEDTLPLAEVFHAEHQFRTTFSADAMRAFWMHNNWVAFGLFDGSVLVGVIMGFISNHFMTTDLLAQEIMWYVKPEHRGNKLALLLFTRFEEWAANAGATAISMVAAPHSSGTVERLYIKNGYTPAGKHFLKFI